MKNLLYWYIYEVKSQTSSLNGVMLRGRIRNLGIEKDFNVLAENTEDTENGVRFAVLDKDYAEIVSKYMQTLADDITVELIDENIPNPVLSKLKVNISERYTL